MKFLQFGKLRLRSIMKSQISFLHVKAAIVTKLLEYELCTVWIMRIMRTACGLPLVRRGPARAECWTARLPKESVTLVRSMCQAGRRLADDFVRDIGVLHAMRACGSLLGPQLVRPQRRNSQRKLSERALGI